MAAHLAIPRSYPEVLMSHSNIARSPWSAWRRCQQQLHSR